MNDCCIHTVYQYPTLIIFLWKARISFWIDLILKFLYQGNLDQMLRTFGQSLTLHAVIMAAPVPKTEWKTNPFHYNFNLATKTGQQIFLEKTKGLLDGKRFDFFLKNAAGLYQFFKACAAWSLWNCISVLLLYSILMVLRQSMQSLFINIQKLHLRMFSMKHWNDSQLQSQLQMHFWIHHS